MDTDDTDIAREWTHVRSPFDLHRWKRANAQAVDGDVPLHITTAGQPWFYAVSFPAEKPPRDQSAPETRLAVVRVDAAVAQGEVAFGVVDKADHFLDETIRRADEPAGPIDLLIDDLTLGRRLLVRDTGEPQAPARVAIRGIDAFALPTLTVGDELAAPEGLHLAPMAGWSRYYGERFTRVSEKLRASRYRLVTRPTPMRWLDGLRVQIVPGNEMSRALYLSGLYEPTVAAVIRRLLPTGGTFFDVGANMGLFSLLAASWVGDGGRVHAFEPSAREHARLLEHVRLNRLEGRVHVERVAMAEQDGTVGLHVAEDVHSGHNTLSDGFANTDVSEVGVETVEACMLDSYVRRHDMRRIDVIKIDVEGSEGRVLAGARETLRTLRPRLVFEVNEPALRRNGSSPGELQRALAEAGYDLWDIDEATAELRPLSDLGRGAGWDVVAAPRGAL